MTAVEEIISFPQETGVALNLKQCAFFKMKVDYLVHTILPGNLAPASAPTREISEAPLPTDKNRMLSFLGGCNVYRRLVPGFDVVARPLNAMV